MGASSPIYEHDLSALSVFALHRPSEWFGHPAEAANCQPSTKRTAHTMFQNDFQLASWAETAQLNCLKLAVALQITDVRTGGAGKEHSSSCKSNDKSCAK
jgi:hypothetical protein